LFGFRSDKKRKANIINKLESPDKPKVSPLSLNLDDRYKEQSASPIAQIRKLRFNPIDFIENITTSFSPSSVFVVEMLEIGVKAVIASRKGAFLEVKYLKNYSYEELHSIYEGVVSKEVEFDNEWIRNFENIFVILTHDILYELPSDVIVVDNRNSEFHKITIPHSKFKDNNASNNMLKKQIRAVTGYNSDEIYTSSVHRVIKKEKKEDESVFAVSLVEKAYYDEMETYLESSGFRFMRSYTIHALLYASFECDNAESTLRLHISGQNAYVVEKYRESAFEHIEFDLSADEDSLLGMIYNAHKVILSGYGEYYEAFKNKLIHTPEKALEYVEHKIDIRTFSYDRNFPKAIIRLEHEINLDSKFVPILSAAYLALFEKKFTEETPGISKHLTLYVYIHKNLKILPFVILFVVIIASYGTYYYFNTKLQEYKEINGEAAKYVTQKKGLEKNLKLLEKNIKKRKKSTKRLEKIFSLTVESEDAKILHEIAQKLPDDMILIKIEKKFTTSGKGRKRKKVLGKPTIIVTGKCYHEKSLLYYIKALEFKEKRVFLVSIKDDMSKLKKYVENRNTFEELLSTVNTRKEYPQLGAVAGVHELNGNKAEGENANTMLKKIQAGNPMQQVSLSREDRYRMQNEKIYFSDTINNTFVLEIK